MRGLSNALLILVGLINLAPVIGVVSAARLQSLYGIEFEGSDLLVLMHHRAALFGIVGGILLVSVRIRRLRPVAYVVGFANMLAFIAITLWIGGANHAIERVALIDAGATLALLVAWAIDHFSDPGDSRTTRA